LVVTALTVYSIETDLREYEYQHHKFVATAPTVYGIIRKIKYSKINKNHGKCRGFLFPSFSDYFVRIKPHIM
jgi:hypothetical protein